MSLPSRLLIGPLLLLLVGCATATERPGPPVATVPPQPAPVATEAPKAEPAKEPSADIAVGEAPSTAKAIESIPEPGGPPTLAKLGTCTRTSIVFVVDRSGSMSGLPIEMSRKALKSALAPLGANDCAGVIAFDSAPSRLVSILPVKDRSAMETLIDRLTAGGGTEIASALVMGLVDVKAATQAKSRAVVLLTDGQSPHRGMREVAEDMAKNGVVLSTIALGDGADQKLLADIASLGNGRAHHVKDPAALPALLRKETDLAIAKKP